MIRVNNEDGSVFIADGERAFHVSLRSGMPEWWRQLEELVAPHWKVIEMEPIDLDEEGNVHAWRPVVSTHLPASSAVSAVELIGVLAPVVGENLAELVVDGLRSWPKAS